MRKALAVAVLAIVFSSVFCPTTSSALQVDPPWASTFTNFSGEWSDPTSTFDPVKGKYTYEFHLPNVYVATNAKTVWFYMEYTGSSTPFTIWIESGTPGTSETTGTGVGGTLSGTSTNTFVITFTLFPQPSSESVFVTADGGQIITYAAMASRCDPVPVPAAVWLFVPGLVGVIGLRRRVLG